MNKSFLVALRAILLACLTSLLSANSVHAGNVSFNLSLTDTKLSISNFGNTSAFYPTAYRLLANGQWQALTLPPGVAQGAELAPGANFTLIWPDTRPLASLPPLEALRPVMVRFFDQAGSSFGQISFFNQPTTAETTLQAEYVDGRMVITPPADKTGAIRASWMLWAQEEGITPLRAQVSFVPNQPDARHIAWQANMGKQRFDLGAGLPVVFLLHETAQGYRLQVVSDGRVQGRQQRAAWLDHPLSFEHWAQLFAVAGLILLAWQLARAWRRKAAA